MMYFNYGVTLLPTYS